MSKNKVWMNGDAMVKLIVLYINFQTNTIKRKSHTLFTHPLSIHSMPFPKSLSCVRISIAPVNQESRMPAQCCLHSKKQVDTLKETKF